MIRFCGRDAIYRVSTVILFVAFLGLVAARPTYAQEDPVPRVEEAESDFREGLDAFEEEDYDTAFRRFRSVYSDHSLNRKTTAALLMAGKALYRGGQYEQAISVLDRLIETYESSSYLEEAQRVQRFAQEQIETEGRASQVVNVGIILPLDGNDASLVQALFNGIRMAVEEYDEAEGRPVRMVFRDTEGNPEQARQAVRELASEGVELIIGPLYSNEARAAAAAAEEAQVVLLAPMATDEDVSEGRSYVFQSNPTITVRGAQMARFAMRGLRMEEFGIVGQSGNSISERMAEGFQREIDEAGREVRFYKLLAGGRAWSDLAEEVGSDTLSSVEAVYLPISGDQAPRLIRGALNSLSQTGLRVRVLGNSEWHDRAIEQEASRFFVTYTNDFYVDETDSAVQSFVRRYRERFGETPDELSFTPRRLVYTGYDVATYLLSYRIDRPEEPLQRVLREAPLFEGLGLRIDFREGNVNRAMYYFRYRSGRTELVE